MNKDVRTHVSRRSMLRYLAWSPLVPWGATNGLGLAQGTDPVFQISTAAQALNVFDLEEVARAKLPPAHFAYLATGVEPTPRFVRTARDLRNSRSGRGVS